MVLTVYKLDASPPVRAVFMVIDALKIPNVEYVDVNLLEGEHMNEKYLKMNPQHTIPVIKHDDFIVWDSHAIVAYLVSKFGKDDSLYPINLKKRAIVDQRLHFDSGILFPAMRGTVEPIFYGDETAVRPENIEKIQKAYGFAEKFLSTDWMAGDHLTIADICCVATISTMNELLPIDNNEFPKLTAWVKRCSQLKIYKRNAPGLEQFRALVQSKLG